MPLPKMSHGMSKSTFKLTAEDNASMWTTRTASERAHSIGMRCASRVMRAFGEARCSLVRRILGSPCPRSYTCSQRKRRPASVTGYS